jgi:hypothetical protein
MPLAEKLLRPAGESLRLRIDKLDDKLTDALLFGIMAPVTAGYVVLVLPVSGFEVARLLAAVLVAVALFVFAARRLFSLLDELRNCRLGFHGERAVAEEINQLMRDGCHVFHDVPMEPYGNQKTIGSTARSHDRTRGDKTKL